MLILGIESTCDETAAALVEDGRHVLSNVVASQAEMHERFGGVVPELASRTHLELILPVIREALVKPVVDAIAVAQGPGLLGSLLVGVNMAKGLALGLEKPLIPVNHVEAHLYAAMMEADVPLPALGVVLSGGHTALLRIEAVGNYVPLGRTVDDAIGEAFDKVAAMLGLPYPGGPAVEKFAKEGKATVPLRAGRVKEKPLAFSFSGLKTAVRYALRDGAEPANVAASFQQAAIDDVVGKARLACEGCRSVVLGGGVCNNRALREQMKTLALPLFWPPAALTLDNAAMIAGLAAHKPPAELTFSAQPRLAL